MNMDGVIDNIENRVNWTLRNKVASFRKFVEETNNKKMKGK